MIQYAWVLELIGAVAVVLWLFWKFVFMRNPARRSPAGNNIVAPADGKVIDVIPFDGQAVELFKGNHRALGLIKTMTSDVAPQGTIVSIFMSPLNVHFNRAPMAGTVLSVKHQVGRFLPANTMHAGLENEKTEILLRHGSVTLKMIQVAGFLARRIETTVKDGQSVTKGQVVGVIKLGSQVTLVLPSTVTVTIKKGERVTAGETIVATKD